MILRRKAYKLFTVNVLSFTDCSFGLGMITGDIRDSQITASSANSMWTLPSAGRLWNRRSVRPRQLSESSTFLGFINMTAHENLHPFLVVTNKWRALACVVGAGRGEGEGVFTRSAKRERGARGEGSLLNPFPRATFVLARVPDFPYSPILPRRLGESSSLLYVLIGLKL